MAQGLMANNNQPASAGFSSCTQSVTLSRLFQYIHLKTGVYPVVKKWGVHMPKRMNMSTVEERLTKVETNLANLADAQRDVGQALNRVSESIHAIQISIERQNASIQQIVELRRDVDEMAKDVDKLKGKVWWLGGVAAACTFIIVNFSRMKDFFH
jgi:DNA repair ATPase RecN